MKDYNNIPDELKNLRIWCTCGYGDTPKRPYKPVNGFLQQASSTDANTWGNFKDAVDIVRADTTGRVGLGFMVIAPYIVIDFDDPKPKSAGVSDEAFKTAYESARELQKAMSAKLSGTYQEISQSGNGLHIIGKADQMPGRKCSTIGVEVYTSDRFIICTGNTYIYEAIHPIDKDWVLAQLPESSFAADFEVAKDERDVVIVIKQICEQHNFAGDTYQKLVGDYRGPFESEDTGKLMVSIAAESRTRDPDFVKELFFASTYFNSEAYKIHLQGNGADKSNNSHRLRKTSTHWNREATTAISKAIPMIAIKEEALKDAQKNIENIVKMPELKPNQKIIDSEGQEAITTLHQDQKYPDWVNPPGPLLAGLSDFFFKASRSPNKRVTTATAVALLSGWAGGTYITDTDAGLTFYGILIGTSGSGKGDVSAGYNALLSELDRKAMDIIDFVDSHEAPEESTGFSAMIKYIAAHEGMYSKIQFIEELGTIFDGMKQGTTAVGMDRFFLKAFNASGPKGNIGAKSYADNEKSTEKVKYVNHCVLGEGTHKSIYDNLELSHVESGFLPRFYVINCGYDFIINERPMREAANVEIDPLLVSEIKSILNYIDSKQMDRDNPFVKVLKTVSAMEKVDALNIKIQKDRAQLIRAGAGEEPVESILKNRFYLMVERLCTLAAVSKNHLDPIVDDECVDWAIKFVEASYRMSVDAFNRGNSNIFQTQETTIYKRVQAYFYTNKKGNGKRSAKLRSAGIIEHAHFTTNSNQWKGFVEEENRGRKPADTIRNIMKSYIESGILHPIEIGEARMIDLKCSGGAKWQLTEAGLEFFDISPSKILKK